MSAKEELQEIREKIICDFSQAWELNDRGHRIEHFTEVERCGNYINEKLQLGFDPKLIMLVAHFHDLFSWSRNNHHLLSASWVQTTDYPAIENLTSEERSLVADGCREHRASNTDVFKNQFAELMSSADRGFPDLDLEKMIQRAIDYRLARGYVLEYARAGAILHIKEKYGTQGYARYPSLYREVFKDDLNNQQRLVDSL